MYNTNMVYIKNYNYNDSLLRYYVIITPQNRIKSLNLPQLSQYMRYIYENCATDASQLVLNRGYFWKNAWSSCNDDEAFFQKYWTQFQTS